MDLLQLGSLLVSGVVLVGLLRVHRYVVREHVIENLDLEEPDEEA